MGTFGFSYVGAVMLLMLFIPNILWTYTISSSKYRQSPPVKPRIFKLLWAFLVYTSVRK